MALDDDNNQVENIESISDVPIVNDQSNNFVHETEGQIADSIESLSQMPEIQPDRWEELDSQERINVLQSVENGMANIQGRPSVAIEAQQMGNNEFGAWNGESIAINTDHVNG